MSKAKSTKNHRGMTPGECQIDADQNRDLKEFLRLLPELFEETREKAPDKWRLSTWEVEGLQSAFRKLAEQYSWVGLSQDRDLEEAREKIPDKSCLSIWEVESPQAALRRLAEQYCRVELSQDRDSEEAREKIPDKSRLGAWEVDGPHAGLRKLVIVLPVNLPELLSDPKRKTPDLRELVIELPDNLPELVSDPKGKTPDPSTFYAGLLESMRLVLHQREESRLPEALGQKADEDWAHASQDADFEAFQQMLPELLEEHKGEYALFVGREFVGAGSLVDMMQLARAEYLGTRFLVQPIQEELPEVCLGGPRLRGR